MRWWVRGIPTIAAVVVAAASFALSYVALRDVAAHTQAVPAHLAWLVPICVDGAVLAGSASMWAASMRGRRMDPVAVLTVVALLVTSVVININHAGPSVLAKTIAALPPLTLLACLELVAGQHRREAADAQAATPHADESSAPPAEAPRDAATPAVIVQTVERDVVAADVTAELRQLAPEQSEQLATSVDGADSTPRDPHRPEAPQRLPGAAMRERTDAVSQVDAQPRPEQPSVDEDAEDSPHPDAEELDTPVAEPDPQPTPEPPTPTMLPPMQQAREPREVQRPTLALQPPLAEPAPPQPATAGVLSAAERVRQAYQARLAAGASPTQPGLNAELAQECGVSPAYVRKVLSPLRRS